MDWLSYIWHEPSEHEEGFYSRSHIVAYSESPAAAAAAAAPLQCAMFRWTEPRNMAYIEDAAQKLREYAKL